MKISIIGSVHQKYTTEGIKRMMEELFHLASGHIIEIEERFFSYLKSIDCPLEGVRMMPPRNNVETDVLISMGGDGTFLRAAKLIAGTPTPIIGVNTGSLGFLANIQPEEIATIWHEMDSGQAMIEERSLLDVYISDANNHSEYKGAVLNEVGIIKRDTASMITVDTYIGGHYVASYEGDGVLVAPPTGSTAYSLSANGPIIHPGCPTIAITPIAPHSLNMRPIVVPDGVEITMKIRSRTGAYLMACDGKSTPLTIKEQVIIKKSQKYLRVLHQSNHSFYEALRNKLMWGKDLRSN